MADAEALRALLDEAHRALSDGDAADAERRAKAVSAIVRAEQDLAEFAALQLPPEEENAEALRAELRSRFRRLVEAEHGYVVDSPASARAALEPLMAAYDFTAAERNGRIVFFHRDESEPARLDVDEFASVVAGEPFAQRGDAAESPVEARVRFLDAARDYLLAGVSARRLDRAEGGVATIEAPLVLEPESAEALAQAVLADARAASETLRIELGPAHLALEPGDRVAIADAPDAFEIARIEDAGARRLEARRVRATSAAVVGLAEPSTPPAPAVAPTPAVSILDLPPLPGQEDDERPLAAVFAAPWLGSHDLHAGAPLSRRATVAQPAIMGELIAPLWPGPVDRWDEGNVVRVRLYGGTLASVAAEDVLAGANAFAIEADGEWEILQSRSCVLVAPNEYELSGLLRGQLGSAHAMRDPHLAGVRIVRLDERLARIDIGAHEWNEALAIAVPPCAGPASDARSAVASVILPHAALRPWAPAHLRARRQASGDVAIDWIRRARAGGDAWGAGEPPLGAPAEVYRLDVLDGDIVKRTIETASASHLYGLADQIADFGAPPGSLRLRVAQLDGSGAPGLNRELTITL